MVLIGCLSSVACSSDESPDGAGLVGASGMMSSSGGKGLSSAGSNNGQSGNQALGGGSVGGSSVGGGSAGGAAGAAPQGCSAGLDKCGNSCVDWARDSANCGGCGVACKGGTACLAGKCQCPIGQKSCDGQCSTLNSKEHCGSCEQACGANQICAVTTCIAETEPCPDGLTRCGDACADLQKTPSTCGTCDIACAPAQECTAGECVCPAADPGCLGGSLLLSVGPTRHYLVNGAGTPVQLRGDTPWALAVQLKREQVVSYLDNRVAKGFNAILFQAINVADGYADNAPANAYGELPFVGDDFTKPNEKYWQHVDYIIDAAMQHGVIAMVSPLYLGFNGGNEGWYAAAQEAGAMAIQMYGAFIAARYGNKDNIIWVNGGDFRPPTLEIPNALAAGILSQDQRHLLTTHWGRNSAGTDGGPTWLTLNSSYTEQANISARVLADYQATPARPTFLIEAYYEGTLQGQPLLTTAGLRQEAWHALLSGACGSLYGHHTIWPFDTGWETAMDSDGAKSMANLNGFFEGVDWWKLLPDAQSKLVTAGRGTLGTAGYVAAAAAADGTLAVAYVPDGREITVDLGQLKGSVTARIFDPAGGSFSDVAGSPFVNGGSQKIDPPGSNDAVLLLQAK